MGHIPLVTVVNGLDNLNPDEFSLKFWHLPIWLHFEVSMKTAAIHVLHNDEDLFMRFEGFIEFGNIWVV
jgi:hypothetical protein